MKSNKRKCSEKAYELALLKEKQAETLKRKGVFLRLCRLAFHSFTEDTAIQRIEMEQKRNAFLAKVQKAVNRLPVNERKIIIMRYMSQDHRWDYEVYNEIEMSSRTYFRIK